MALQPGGGAVAWELGIFGGLEARRLDSAGLPVGPGILLAFFRDAVLGPLDVAPDGTPWLTFATTAQPRELVFSQVSNNRREFVIRSSTEMPDFEPGGVVALGGSNVMTSFEDLRSDGISRQWVWRLGVPPPPDQPRHVSSTQGRGRPRICPRPNGSFVVAWRTLLHGSYGVAYSLRGPNGEELRAATALVSNLTAEPNHALACARDGRFAIAWESSVHPGAQGSDVQVQRFDRQARRVPRLDLAHAATAGDQRFAALAFEPGGALLAAFQSVVGGHQRIFARRFAANGVPDGVERRVDSGPGEVGEKGPGHPGIAAVGTAGRALVVWSEGHHILGRKLRR